MLVALRSHPARHAALTIIALIWMADLTWGTPGEGCDIASQYRMEQVQR